MANMEETIINMLKTYYPTLECGPGTPVYEYVVRPMAFLWSRHQDGEVELLAANTFADPANMGTEDMDRLMTRYFETRKTGATVFATVRLVFKTRQDYYIPVGTEITASNGRIYNTLSSAYYSALEIPGNDTDGYIIDVNVASTEQGNAYNAYTNETCSVTGSLAEYIKAAYFTQDSTDGGSSETNETFYKRVKNSTTLKNLTTYRGVQAILYDLFNIKNVVPIGLRDAEMRRDLVEIPSPSGNYVVHRGGSADIYVQLNPYSLVPGYKAPLGFPYSYRGVSIEDQPTQLMANWNNLGLASSDTNLRCSVYEEISGLSTNSYMTTLTSSIGPVQDFVLDGDYEALHSNNIVKQLYPLVVRAKITISDPNGTDAIATAKTAFVDYVDGLQPGDAPNVTDVGYALRAAGIAVVHTPMILDCYYLNEALQMERYSLDLARFPETSLLKPTESDSLKFSVEADSQISARTAFFYTNENLVSIEVV